MFVILAVKNLLGIDRLHFMKNNCFRIFKCSVSGITGVTHVLFSASLFSLLDSVCRGNKRKESKGPVWESMQMNTGRVFYVFSDILGIVL